MPHTCWEPHQGFSKANHHLLNLECYLPTGSSTLALNALTNLGIRSGNRSSLVNSTSTMHRTQITSKSTSEMTSEPSSPKFSNRTRCRQVGAAGTAIRVAMSEGTLRIVGRFVAVVVLSLVAAACSFNFSSPYQAYSSLTDEELVLVVPDTADWAHGDVCPDGGDCSGSMTAASVSYTHLTLPTTPYV